MSSSYFQEYIVSVDNPQKHLNPMETYISFRVTTLVKQESEPNEKHVVRRRYNDFLWLRNKLIESFPVLVVPALPAKHSVLEQLDRYSKTFVLSRMAMLHSYLQRLTSHPVFSCSPAVRLFLTAKSTEFTMHSQSSPKLLERLSGSLQTLTGYHTRNNHLYPEFNAIKHYVDSLSKKLVTIQSVSAKIYKERIELSVDLEEAQRSVHQWACLEHELNDVLTNLAVTIGSTASSQQTHLLKDYSVHVDQPLDEYLYYIEAVKEALSRRDAIQLTYENLLSESNRKRLEKEQLTSLDSNSNGFTFRLWKTSNSSRIQKITEALPSIDQKVEESHDQVEIANESIKSDLERWNSEKASDIKRILSSIADQHVLHYQETLDTWEKALETIKHF